MKELTQATITTGQLHKDADLLEFYHENENWDLLDSHLTEIIKSDDINRMRFVIFKSFTKDPMFKDVLSKILYKVENKLGKKLY